MNPRLALPLTAAVCLALGFLGGWVLGGDVPLAPTASADRDASARPPSPSDAALAPTPGTREPGREAARPDDRASARVEDDEVSRLARSAVGRLEDAKAPPADGDATMDGVVVDRSGAPIAGAVVELLPSSFGARRRSSDWFAAPEPGGAAPPEVGELAEQWARETLERRSATARATTDASGRFEAAGLAPGDYEVSTYAEGFGGDQRWNTTGRSMEIVMDAVRTIALEPRHPDGTVPDVATIVLSGSNNHNELIHWSRDAPTIEVWRESVRAQAFAGEVLEVTGLRSLVATLQSGEQVIHTDHVGSAPVVLLLAETPIVRVELRDPEPRTDRVGAGPKWRQADGGTVGTMASLTDGRHAATVPAPGSYVLTAQRHGLPGSVTSSVEVAAGVNDFVLELPAIDRDALTEVRCVGPDGRPVRSVVLGVAYEPGEPPSGLWGAFVERPGGRYLVTTERLFPESRGAQPIDPELVGTSEALGEARVRVGAPGAPMTLTFQEPASLTVRIDGDPGVRIAFRVVPKASRNNPRTHRRDRHGRYARQDVQPGNPIQVGVLPRGSYTILLYAMSDRDKLLHVVMAREIDLGSGHRLEVLDAPQLDSFEVFAPPEHSGRLISLEPAPQRGTDIDSRHALIGENGQARFAGIPPGRYRIRGAVDGGMLAAEFTVPCGSIQLEFVPKDD